MTASKSHQPIGARVYIDVSGSMSNRETKFLYSCLTEIPGLDVKALRWFSSEVSETPDLYNGPTSFKPIADDVARYPSDKVVVITDGHAPMIEPPNKDSWVWLITSGGSVWPRERGMATFVLDGENLLGDADLVSALTSSV